MSAPTENTQDDPRHAAHRHRHRHLRQDGEDRGGRPSSAASATAGSTSSSPGGCKYKAHDEHGTCHVGDLVELVEARPTSKTKRWRVLRMVQKNKEAAS